MGNEALKINGFTNTVTTNNHITTRGSDWYWTVCAVMLVWTLAILGSSWTRPRSHRLFHWLLAVITLVAGVSYFSMASNLGWTAIHVEFPRSSPRVAGDMRQIFYVRYIDYFITFPLLLTVLLLSGGLPNGTVVFTVFFGDVAVVASLVGALVKSTYKWGYFTFGVFALIIVSHIVFVDGRTHARAVAADIGRNYTICAAWLISLSFLYPIAWGVSEGGNVIAPDSEAVFYGILDLLTRPVFATLVLWFHRNLDMDRLGLSVRDPGQVGPSPGTEKSGVNGSGTADTNAPAPASETV